MGWSVGWDSSWNRDIGYGVPAVCDHPSCNEQIDRGVSQVCGGEPYGGDEGCGLFFCDEHLGWYFKDDQAETMSPPLCVRCGERFEDEDQATGEPFDPKPDVLEWVEHKLTHPSWQEWRDSHPGDVAALEAAKEVRP